MLCRAKSKRIHKLCPAACCGVPSNCKRDGVSPIHPGDVISAYVERIGTMEVKVRAA